MIWNSALVLVLALHMKGSCFLLDCDHSLFTATGTSFCVGIPLECTVILDSELCKDCDDVVFIMSGDLEIVLESSHQGRIMPSFSVIQTNLTLEILIDYIPAFPSGDLTVVVSVYASGNCSFEVSHTSVVRDSVQECLYPLSMSFTGIGRETPAVIKGGETIQFSVSLLAKNASLQNMQLFMEDSHPSLVVIHPENAQSSGSDIKSHLLLNEVFLLPRSEQLITNVTLWIQPFVLPQAQLYFSILVTYNVPSHSSHAFLQREYFFNEFQSADVSYSNIFFSLPYYSEEDRVDFTFPPHVGDLFLLSVNMIVPCVSTQLNLSLTLPAFMSDSFTMFHVALTQIVNISAPLNIHYITELCDHRVSNFSPHLCDINLDTIFNGPTLSESEGIYSVRFPPLQFGFSSEHDCTSQFSHSNCSCTEEILGIDLAGVVVSSMQCDNETLAKDERLQCFLCDNQTLADNITWKLDYVKEITSQQDLDLSIDFVSDSIEELSAVNASTPAISLPINSFSGDAGDQYNITFGVLHNSEYSSFTAYDLNYTFSIDDHLEPELSISICHFNDSSIPPICEEELFINRTISRNGFHPKFILNVDKLELTIEVTIIQDVAPQMSFCNPGDVIFQSFQENNTMGILPLVCTNSSCGGVSIDPVILNPWIIHYSSVESTVTETPASRSYVTIGEQFNMTIKACMPECWTGITLIVELPQQGSATLVVVNDAYVTFIGSELINTTLQEGDDLNSTDSITLKGHRIHFMFGSRILIPDNNMLIADEQCFEIGLNCTVKNIPSLVDGNTLRFQAFVETDNNVQTRKRRISLRITEPLLQFNPSIPVESYDGGDIVSSIVTTSHAPSSQRTSAFLFTLSYIYNTTIFLFNNSSPESIIFLNNSVALVNYTTAEVIDNLTGSVPFFFEEKIVEASLMTNLSLTLSNEVRSQEIYEVCFETVWYSSPHNHEEVRVYHHSGVIPYTITDIKISIVETTSNNLTPDQNLQVQEQIFARITVIFPEGIVTGLDLLVNHDDYIEGSYSFNITHGEVIHVGSNLNLTVAEGDTLLSSPFISSPNIREIQFECGLEIRNSYDNVVTDNDKVVFYLEAFVSDDGILTTSQAMTLKMENLNTGSFEVLLYLLSHPDLQVASIVTTPPTLFIDGGDQVSAIATINMKDTGAFVAYDVVTSLSVIADSSLLNSSLSNMSVINGDSCFAGGAIDFILTSSEETYLHYLLRQCQAEFIFIMEIPDAVAIADDTFTFVVNIKEYFSVDSNASIMQRQNYGPNEPYTMSGRFKSPTQSVIITNSSESNFIAPLDILDVKHTVTFPEGSTLDTSIAYSITTGSSAQADSFVIHQPYAVTIFPMTSYLFPFLGNVSNPSDNEENLNDQAFFNFRITALQNATGSTFKLSASLQFDNTEKVVLREVSSQEYTVILPTIAVHPSVSNTSVQFGDTVSFLLNVTRTDEVVPEYDIIISATIYHPNSDVLIVMFDMDDVIEMKVGNVETKATLALPQLNYSNLEEQATSFGDEYTHCLTFNGTITYLAYSLPYIELHGHIEYESTPTNGHQYQEEFIFPKIFLRNASISLEIVSTSFNITHGNVLVRDEEALFSANVTNIFNFQDNANLTISFQFNHSFLNIVALETIDIGDGLSVLTTETAESQSDSYSIMLIDIQRRNEPEVDMCLDCFVTLYVRFQCNSNELTSQVTNISSSVTFHPVSIEDAVEVVVGPLLHLEAAFSGQKILLETGEPFEVALSVVHGEQNVDDALITALSVEYSNQYLSYLPVSHYALSTGEFGVYALQPAQGNADILNGSTDLLLKNEETLKLFMDFQPISNAAIKEPIMFKASLEYTSAQDPNLTYFIESSQQSVFVTETFLPISSELSQSSSSFTNGTDFVINEVFLIHLKCEIPPGIHDLKYEAYISSATAQLPVAILETSEDIPANISIGTTEVSIRQSGQAVIVTWELQKVENSLSNNQSMIVLMYTAVVLDSASFMGTDNVMRLAGSSFFQDILVSRVEDTAIVLQPLLLVNITSQIFPQTTGLLAAIVNVTLMHSSTSTGPAFLVELFGSLSNALMLSNYTLKTSRNLSVVSTSSTSVVGAQIDVLPIEAEMNLMLWIEINLSSIEGAIHDQIFANYITIKHEGIGLQYSLLYAGRNLSANNTLCLMKRESLNIIEVINTTVLVTTVFITVLIIVLMIIVILTIYYFTKICRVTKKIGIAPAALIAAAMGKTDETTEEHMICSNKQRPLFSSLLDALPEKSWKEREDIHECREAAYITEAETSLLYAKSQMVIHLFKYFMHTKTGLTKDKIVNAINSFDLKVNILRKTLQDSVQDDLQNAAIQCGANLITKREEHDQKNAEDVAEVMQTVAMNFNISEELLEHVKEQSNEETADELKVIEIKLKLRKIQILRRYINHYLLGLRALSMKYLWKYTITADSHTVMTEFHKVYKYGEWIALNESISLEEMASVRRQRQKSVLLENKFMEANDEQMIVLLRSQAKCCSQKVTRHFNHPPDENKIIEEEFENSLLQDFMKGIDARKINEQRINQRAKSALHKFEKQFLKPSPKEHYKSDIEMINSEFLKWHQKQMRREDGLNTVENQAFHELKTCWDKWKKNFEKLIAVATVSIRGTMIKQGLPIETCAKLMEKQARERLKLSKTLVTTVVVERAKFQARQNFLDQQHKKTEQYCRTLHQMKAEVEKKYLQNFARLSHGMNAEDSHVLEEYHDDLERVDRSLSIERLSIHIKLKKKIAARTSRKLKAAFRQYLKVTFEEGHKERNIHSLLHKRRDALIEICTRFYEEERKKAEDEVTEEEETVLNVSTVQLHPELDVPRLRSPSLVPAQLEDDTMNLLKNHEQNLLKLTERLDEDRKKAIQDLQLKMNRRKQKLLVRSISILQIPNFKNSKFRELVKQYVLNTRLQEIREQHLADLKNEMDILEKQHADTRQEAMEKLEKKFEAFLARDGRFSPNKLVLIFEEIQSFRKSRERQPTPHLLNPLVHKTNLHLQPLGPLRPQEEIRKLLSEGTHSHALEKRPGHLFLKPPRIESKGKLPPILDQTDIRRDSL